MELVGTVIFTFSAIVFLTPEKSGWANSSLGNGCLRNSLKVCFSCLLLNSSCSPCPVTHCVRCKAQPFCDNREKYP